MQERREEKRSDEAVVFERIHPMQRTFEQKTKRFRELMDELSKQLETSKNEIIETRKKTDEMFVEVTIRMNQRQQAFDYMNREIFGGP